MKENTTHPGLPNYTGPNRGIFILLHHGDPVELSRNVAERVEYINTSKEAHEQPERLMSLQVAPRDKFEEEWRLFDEYAKHWDATVRAQKEVHTADDPNNDGTYTKSDDQRELFKAAQRVYNAANNEQYSARRAVERLIEDGEEAKVKAVEIIKAIPDNSWKDNNVGKGSGYLSFEYGEATPGEPIVLDAGTSWERTVPQWVAAPYPRLAEYAALMLESDLQMTARAVDKS